MGRPGYAGPRVLGADSDPSLFDVLFNGTRANLMDLVSAGGQVLEMEDRNGSGTTEMDEVDALLSYANDLGVLDSFTDRGGRLLAPQSPKSVSASGHGKHNKRGNEPLQQHCCVGS